MNKGLQQLHELLIAKHQALFAKLDEASDVDEAKMILTEMQEILHRIDVLQGLLFRETTTALRNSLTKVDRWFFEGHPTVEAVELELSTAGIAFSRHDTPHEPATFLLRLDSG